jgi:hypothetical protein
MQGVHFPLLESVLSDLRRDSVSVVVNGFEVLADEPFLHALCAMLDDPCWQPHNRFLLRYITGFGVWRFHWTFFSQPTSPWIFLNESDPVPTPQSLLRYTLRRAILLRYQRIGVCCHVFNNRIRTARALRVADKLLQRQYPNEC